MIAMLVIAALGGAVWVGMQLRGDPMTVASTDPYLIELNEHLAEMSTPGERWLHLRAVNTSPPAGRQIELRRLERLAFQALQAAVDREASKFTGAGWQEVVAWLRSSAGWPDRPAFEREYLMKRVQAAAGMLPRQLPSTINTARIDELLAAVDAELADRDADLLHQLDAYLGTELPDRVDERLRAGDFARANKLWVDVLSTFCDGVRRPTRERLADSTIRQAEDRVRPKAQKARIMIDAAESRVAEAMQGEVATVLRYLDDKLAQGFDPAEVAERIAQFRQELLQVWPASSRFRPDRDPWREIERMIGELQQRTALAVTDKAIQRFDHRCDLAWRALCHGEVADALVILEDIVPPTETLRVDLAEHRQALQAAAAVHARLLAVLVRHGEPVLAVPRTGNGLSVQLRADAESGRPMLLAQAIGATARSAVLTEFRFSALLAEVRKIDRNPFDGLDADEVARGQLVFRLIGDDLAGIAALVRGLDEAFLFDDVFPRIQRVRSERPEVVLDRAGLLARLQEALVRAKEPGGLLHGLENAIVSFESRISENDRTEHELRQLRAAKVWHRLALRRADIYDDISFGSPPGAVVRVGIDEDQSEITAEMTVTAGQLERGATEGWQLQNGMLEFAGGDRPWSELNLQRLDCDTGLPIGGSRKIRTVLQIDVVLPPASVEQRFYIVEFRGVAVLLALSQDNAVHAALVKGDPRRQEHSARAYEAAMNGVLERSKAIAVPGAIHRLTIDITASTGRARAAVKVGFEGRELIDQQHDIDSQAAANLVIYPRQEMRLQGLTVRGFGL